MILPLETTFNASSKDYSQIRWPNLLIIPHLKNRFAMAARYRLRYGIRSMLQSFFLARLEIQHGVEIVGQQDRQTRKELADEQGACPRFA
ncbi:MAG: hypothetical protein ACJ8FY_12265 [Gemmataceae bacterium]